MLIFKKRTFFTNQTDYLVYAIEPGRPDLAEHIADVIRKLEVSETVTELSSFVNLCNFIDDLSPTPQ